MTDAAVPSPTTGTDRSTGKLLSQFTAQSSQLVRQELQLVQAEMQQKAKSLGVGAGLFGTAGIASLYGLGVLLAAVILALALVIPSWLSALLVAIVLFAIAGVAALLGKKRVAKATPLAPEQAVKNLKLDVATVKGDRG